MSKLSENNVLFLKVYLNSPIASWSEKLLPMADERNAPPVTCQSKSCHMVKGWSSDVSPKASALQDK